MLEAYLEGRPGLVDRLCAAVRSCVQLEEIVLAKDLLLLRGRLKDLFSSAGFALDDTPRADIGAGVLSLEAGLLDAWAGSLGWRPGGSRRFLAVGGHPRLRLGRFRP